MRVLAVDDNESVLTVIKEACERKPGIEVDVARSGEEAVSITCVVFVFVLIFIFDQDAIGWPTIATGTVVFNFTGENATRHRGPVFCRLDLKCWPDCD